MSDEKEVKATAEVAHGFRVPLENMTGYGVVTERYGCADPSGEWPVRTLPTTPHVDHTFRSPAFHADIAGPTRVLTGGTLAPLGELSGEALRTELSAFVAQASCRPLSFPVDGPPAMVITAPEPPPVALVPSVTLWQRIRAWFRAPWDNT